MRDEVQGAASAAGAGVVERRVLLRGEQGGCVGSSGAEMKPAEGKGLTAVAVGEQTEVADFDEA